MPAITPFNVAMGIGAGGAMVDVTSSISGPDGVTYTYGRQSEFSDVAPGTFTFVLENQSGIYTPNNPNTTLATPVTEGMAVSWLEGTRLVSGVIQSIGFAGTEDQWGRVTITCMDVLGVANRTQLTYPAESAALAQGEFYWPFDDPVGSSAAQEVLSGWAPAFGATSASNAGVAFGIAGIDNVTDTQAQFTVPAAISQTYTAVPAGVFTGFGFALGTPPAGGSAWGMWITPGNYTSFFEFESDYLLGWRFGIHNTTFVLYAVSTSSYVSAGALVVGESYYVSAQISLASSAYTIDLYVNGVLVASDSQPSPIIPSYQFPTMILGNASYGATLVTISQVSFGEYRINGEASLPTTEAARIVLLAQTVADLTLGTVDSNLSTAVVDTQSTDQQSALSAMLDLMRTEQGQIYSTTAGSLLSPVQTVNVRARTRPTTVQASFDAVLEVSGVPQFLRDITYMYSMVTAEGPTNTATVIDTALIPRAGSSNDEETVVNLEVGDLTLWAQDRINRGANVNLKIASVTIDALTAPASLGTAAKVFGLTLGDLVEIVNLPTATTLGFTAWYGWFLGATESHTPGSSATDSFTLYLQPVLPATGIFDTNLFASGGNNVLNSAITSSASTCSAFAEDNTSYFQQSPVGYTIQIDQEQMTVTAAGSPSAGSQTLTLTRGVNGTAAAAHAANAPIEIIPTSLFAF